MEMTSFSSQLKNKTVESIERNDSEIKLLTHDPPAETASVKNSFRPFRRKVSVINQELDTQSPFSFSLQRLHKRSLSPNVFFQGMCFHFRRRIPEKKGALHPVGRGSSSQSGWSFLLGSQQKNGTERNRWRRNGDHRQRPTLKKTLHFSSKTCRKI